MIIKNIGKKKLYNSLNSEFGFSLTESIISIVLLISIVTISIQLVSLRQATIYKANLRKAINDEIRRDIEKLKIELWNEHYVAPSKNSSAFYNTGISSNSNYYCDDVIRTFARLPSWKNRTWTPGSDERTVVGQTRNRIFMGKPVVITRIVNSKRPLNIGNITTIDKSIAEINYTVNKFNEKIHWTSILLTSEAHSWCPPNNR
tara:strand:+ start:20540 stop:21148 length:609 start_codon:yes stop_codon:yes gene_type:complete